MNFKNIKTMAIACLLIGLTSCSIDEITPINQLVEDNVITNEASANAVLNRIYSRTRSFRVSNMSSATSFFGVAQDELFGVFGSNGFSVNNIPDDSNLLNGIYTENYANINDANFFIKLVEAGNAVGLDDTRKNEMLAEARFLRAHAHFNLLRMFGEFYNTGSTLGVVVSTTPISTPNPIARSSVQETYDSIMIDLEYAITNAGSSMQHFYVSATTAQAFLAKVQLYMGDYTNAATNATAVINNADGYALAPNYADIFTERWGQETLFAPFADGFNEGSTDQGTSQSTLSAYLPSMLFRGVADMSDGVMDAIDNGFGEPFSGYDTRFLYAYSFETYGTNGNGKYPFRDFSSQGTGGNTFYYLRMAEVYLIYAEAEARRSGGVLSDALDRLNDVRTRAGVPVKILTDQATLLADIRDDKMIELSSENAESYYDLIRYDILGDASASALKTTLISDKFMFPIPVAALAGNSLLVPNPSN